MRWASEALNSAEFSGRSFGPGKRSFLKIGPFSLVSGLVGNIARIFIKPTDTTPNKIKTSSANLEKSNVDNTRNMAKTSSLSSSSHKHLSITEGDRVMDSLGMKHSSVRHANHMLLRLISFHLAVSLFGLIFQPKST